MNGKIQARQGDEAQLGPGGAGDLGGEYQPVHGGTGDLRGEHLLLALAAAAPPLHGSGTGDDPNKRNWKLARPVFAKRVDARDASLLASGELPGFPARNDCLKDSLMHG